MNRVMYLRYVESNIDVSLIVKMDHNEYMNSFNSKCVYDNFEHR